MLTRETKRALQRLDRQWQPQLEATSAELAAAKRAFTEAAFAAASVLFGHRPWPRRYNVEKAAWYQLRQDLTADSLVPLRAAALSLLGAIQRHATARFDWWGKRRGILVQNLLVAGPSHKATCDIAHAHFKRCVHRAEAARAQSVAATIAPDDATHRRCQA